MEYLLYFIAYMITVLLGGFWIADAVRSFKEKRYFLFGVDLMLAMYDVIVLLCMCINRYVK